MGEYTIGKITLPAFPIEAASSSSPGACSEKSTSKTITRALASDSVSINPEYKDLGQDEKCPISAKLLSSMPTITTFSADSAPCRTLPTLNRKSLLCSCTSESRLNQNPTHKIALKQIPIARPARKRLLRHERIGIFSYLLLPMRHTL